VVVNYDYLKFKNEINFRFIKHNKDMETELLLTPEAKRHTLLPIKYSNIWDAYKFQEACIWHAHDVDLSQDLHDWNNLNDNERAFLKKVLAFFASSDLIVNENLAERFSKDVKILEARIAYDVQKFTENVHSEMYSLLINTYISDPVEANTLFNSIENDPIVAKKAQWAYKWIDGNQNFSERLVGMAAVEGIFFSGSFCAIYWVKERGILPGLCKSNDYIARDEGLHTDFAVLLYGMLNQRCSTETFHAIIKEAVELETEFITDALPCNLLGMNANSMKKYIQFVANRLVLQFGYPELYPDASCPFPFMERINLSSKSNFFERKPTEYNKLSTSKLEAENPYTVCVKYDKPSRLEE